MRLYQFQNHSGLEINDENQKYYLKDNKFIKKIWFEHK